jgi:molybdate transport system substrate-binding protein
MPPPRPYRPTILIVMQRFTFTAVVMAISLATDVSRANDGITVFAASSLTSAVSEISQRYTKASGERVRLSFASSSALARQIAAGAPADIYLSANQDWMDYLAKRGLIDSDSRAARIGNRLVLVVPANSPLQRMPITRTLDLPKLLAPDGRIAVGDPAHVPAGAYAKHALIKLELWTDAAPRLARLDNVRHALALVERGETPLGIVYATDAKITDKVRIVGEFPTDSHPAITYPFVILKGRRNESVAAFYAYLTGKTGLTVFRDFGFMTP